MPELTDKIQTKRSELVAIKDRLTEIEIIAKDAEDGLDDETLNEIDELEEQQKCVEKSLNGYIKLEQNLKAKAQPVSNHYNAPGDPAKSERKFDVLPKMILCHVVAHQERKSLQQVMQERFKNDVRVDAVLKSVVMPADTTTPGWAMELVQNEIMGFLDLLTSESVYARLAARSMQFSFDGAGQITIPRRNSAQRLSGAWVGEGGNIPVKAGSLGSTVLSRYKMAVISCFTKELSRSSTPQIESIIRNAILADTAEALDASFLDANPAVAGVRPPGILNGVTPTASSGTTPANIATDLKAALAPLIASNSMGQPVWLMHENIRLSLMMMTSATGEYLYRNEMAGGTLLGYPIISSTAIPDNTLTAIDVNSLATAMGMPEIDVSDTATVVMSNADDTAPTHAIDAAGAIGTEEQVIPDGGIDVVPKAAVAGGAGVAGYFAQSMFQTWSTATRMVMPISYGTLRTGSIGQVNAIAW